MAYQNISRLISTLCMLWAWTLLPAQDSPRITANFIQEDLASILSQLEKESPYRFYFKLEELPQDTFSISFKKESIDRVCRRLLAQTDLRFFFFKKYTVIIVQEESYQREHFQKLDKQEQQRKDSLTLQAVREDYYQLEEVTISSMGEKSLLSSGGSIRLDPVQLALIPVFMGEPDLMKGVLFQPGISSLGEGASGIHVRGGNNDENLILLGENSLLHTNHAFGFFSGINSGLVQEVNLFKGFIPAYYGGSLSSVMDVQLKQASTENKSLEGSLGPISARFSAEIPLIKGKSSILLGGRSLFSDWILQQIEIPELKSSSMFFYDLNANYQHYLNDKNILSAEFYSSSDDFQFSNALGIKYESLAANVKLTQILKKKWISNLLFAYNSYSSNRENLSTNTLTGFETAIEHYKLRERLTFSPRENLSWDLGTSFIYYTSSPGRTYQLGPASSSIPFRREQKQGLDATAFLNLHWDIAQRWRLEGGLRFSSFHALGPGQELVYEDSFHPRPSEIKTSLSYANLERIVSYSTPEPRLGVNYKLNSGHALKLAYSRTAQYIFQLSSFDAPVPTDTWMLSTSHLRPQRAHNLSAEWVSSELSTYLSSSLGVYFRKIQDLKDYVDFADLFSLTPLETEVLHAEGRAYGLELNLNKNRGKMQFNFSYTLSRSEKKTNGNAQDKRINDNQWYLSNFDKPHELNFFLNYQMNRRHRFALSFNLASGRPFTAPIGYFDIDGQSRTPIYSARNQFRIPAYHRLDISYTFGKSLHRERSWKGSWTLGLYNVYGRRNAYSLFFTQARFARPKANRLSILGNIFPSITYNFNWKE